MNSVTHRMYMYRFFFKEGVFQLKYMYIKLLYSSIVSINSQYKKELKKLLNKVLTIYCI